MESLTASGELEHFAEKIKSRKADPYSVAEEIAQNFFTNRIRNENRKKQKKVFAQNYKEKENLCNEKTKKDYSQNMTRGW